MYICRFKCTESCWVFLTVSGMSFSLESVRMYKKGVKKKQWQVIKGDWTRPLAAKMDVSQLESPLRA